MPAKINPSKLIDPQKIAVRTVMKHIHSFIRHGKTKTGVIQWKCSDPDCMYLISQELIVGKRTLCPNCMEYTFVLTNEDLRRAKPRCPQKCSETLEHEIQRMHTPKTKNILDSLFPGADLTNPIGDD